MNAQDKLQKRIELIDQYMAAGLAADQAITKLKAEHPELCTPDAAADDWNGNPALRAEFQNKKENYDAYLKAVTEGKVKIIGGVQR